jgi:hypothetical protein
MDPVAWIAQLRRELAAVKQCIDELERLTEKCGRGRRPKSFSAEERQAIGERIRQYWAKRREERRKKAS